MIFTLHTKAQDHVPFCCRPAMSWELDGAIIHCNEEPVLPGDRHPYNMRLYVIADEYYGAICAVWSTNDSAALDVACNLGALDSLLANDNELADIAACDAEGRDIVGFVALGNAGEYFNLDSVWLYDVEWDVARDWDVLKAFARCGDNDTLDYV